MATMDAEAHERALTALFMELKCVGICRGGDSPDSCTSGARTDLLPGPLTSRRGGASYPQVLCAVCL